MTRLLRTRHALVAAVAALSLVAPAGATGAATPVASAAEQAAVDPSLWSQVAVGTVPAVLAWDDEVATRAQVTAHLRRHGIEHHAFSALSMAVACMGGPADVRAAATVPGAVSVWGDETMPAAALPAATGGLGNGSGAPAAASSVEGLTGEGVGIAVLDTGIDGTHADLEFGPKTRLNARVLVSHLETMGPGNDTCLVDTYDDGRDDSETISGHGTHIAGVAAGTGAASDGEVTGVAPGADLIGLNIVEQSTPEHTDGDVQFSLIRFVAAVNYVISRALDGGPTVAKVALLGWTSDGLYDPWHPHTLAVRDLYDFGISVVVPVGNGGPEPSQCDQAATCHFNRLAAGRYPIGVGAAPNDSTQQLENYSSRGDPVPRESRGESVVYEPTVVAPGTQILGPRRLGVATYTGSTATRYPLAGQGAGAQDDVTDVSYQAMTGTSVAAAQVAGTIALMQQAAVEAGGCFLRPVQVKDILEATAAPMDGYERWEVGAGAIDAAAAVAAAREAIQIPSVDPWLCPRDR